LFPLLVAAEDFTLFLCVETGSGAEPTFKLIGTVGKQGKSHGSVRLTSNFSLLPRVIILVGITSIPPSNLMGCTGTI